MSRHSTGGGSRPERVADQIQKELAQLVQRELKDPRLGMITISAVKVTRDYAFADVYFTMLEATDEQTRQEAVACLEHAQGFLRSSLAKRIKLRTMPRLRFRYDETTERGNYLNALINRAVTEDRSHHNESSLGDGEEN